MAQKIKNIFYRLFFYHEELSEREYRLSRILLILSGPTAGMINTLIAGPFFIGFLVYLGASVQYCAIIGAIPQLGCILQMISPYIFERLKHRKLLICLSCFLFRFSVGTVILVPYLVSEKSMRLGFILVIYTLAFLVAGFVTPGLSQWYLSVAPQSNRGRFLAVKDIATMFCVSVLSVGVGRMIDHYKAVDKALTGFTIMFGLALILSVIDFILISQIDEPLIPRDPIKQSLLKLIRLPIEDKPFRKMILFLSVWSFAIQLSASFIPVYMLSVLNLSYTYISGVAVAGNIVGMISIFLWGRLADKTTWFYLLKISAFIIVLCYFGWAFVTRKNAPLLVFILQIALICCNGAFQMASSNLQFNLSPELGKTAYLGVTSAIACVISFAGAMMGSVLYKQLKNFKINIFLFQITNIQVIFLFTGLLLITAFAFVRKQQHFKI